MCPLGASDSASDRRPGWTDPRSPTPDEVATAATIRPRRLSVNTGIRNPGCPHAGASADSGDTGLQRQTADRSGPASDVATFMGSPCSMRSRSCPTTTATIRALAARYPAAPSLVRAAKTHVPQLLHAAETLEWGNVECARLGRGTRSASVSRSTSRWRCSWGNRGAWPRLCRRPSGASPALLRERIQPSRLDVKRHFGHMQTPCHGLPRTAPDLFCCLGSPIC